MSTEDCQESVPGRLGIRDERAEEYFTWKDSRTAEDFKGYIKNVRGVIKLSHSGILGDASIAASLARSNPFIKKDLEDMETELRELGLLPPEGSTEDPPSNSEVDSKSRRPARSARDKRRIEELEQEVANLRLERNDAREALDRYGMLEKYLSETMRLIR